MGYSNHLLKSFSILFLGLLCKSLLLPEANILVHFLYIVVLLGIFYKYCHGYKNPKVQSTDFNVCIIGAGFSGIGMAIKLKEIGVKFRIIEKDSRLGGTWWENQYPGCGCDVPSHNYSYSFFLNPNWSKIFTLGPEILQYLEHTARSFGIKNQIEFNKKVQKALWNKEKSLWMIELANGEKFTANVIVSGVGGISIPKIPEFKGKDSFKGESFHSAQWNKDCDLTGKRVAVIGTGASAVQIIPCIASKVKHLYVYQRSPPWVVDKINFGYPSWCKWLFTIYPLAMHLHRLFLFWLEETSFFLVWYTASPLRRFVEQFAIWKVKKTVKNPEVAKKLIPSYIFGCKRITPSNDYLPTFNKSNVTLITDPIECFEKDSIKTENGVSNEVDVIIYATGFDSYKSYHTFDCYGLENEKVGKEQSDGLAATNSNPSLQEEWGDYPNAYLSLTYPRFPNLFFLLGPGSILSHNTVVAMIECGITYTIDAISNMIQNDIKSIEVKKSVNEKYKNWVQQCIKNKVFDSPTCTGWNRNSKGINYAIWPTNVTHFWWVTRKVNLNDYTCN